MHTRIHQSRLHTSSLFLTNPSVGWKTRTSRKICSGDQEAAGFELDKLQRLRAEQPANPSDLDLFMVITSSAVPYLLALSRRLLSWKPDNSPTPSLKMGQNPKLVGLDPRATGLSAGSTRRCAGGAGERDREANEGGRSLHGARLPPPSGRRRCRHRRGHWGRIS